MNDLSVNGLSVPLQYSEISPLIWESLSDGTYEQKESYLAPRVAKPNDRIVELGCGLGIVANLVARVPGVSIRAFDANPANIPLARRIAEANGSDNIVFEHSLFAAGPPKVLPFYVREDMWMSSLLPEQGPYKEVISLTTRDIDAYLLEHPADLLTMDIEGGELGLLSGAQLPGVERVFFEIHDHLYSMPDLGKMFAALMATGFIYEPRRSSGACVSFTRDHRPRTYRPDFLSQADQN